MSRTGSEIFCSEQVLSILKAEIDRLRDIRERAGRKSSDAKKIAQLTYRVALSSSDPNCSSSKKRSREAEDQGDGVARRNCEGIKISENCSQSYF
jgi:hypothetical protein